MRRRSSLALTPLLALALAATLQPAPAAPERSERPGPSRADRDRPTPPDWLQVRDGAAVPQFDLADAVVETVWVQTPVDSDLDGLVDEMRAAPGASGLAHAAAGPWSSSTDRPATLQVRTELRTQVTWRA